MYKYIGVLWEGGCKSLGISFFHESITELGRCNSLTPLMAKHPRKKMIKTHAHTQFSSSYGKLRRHKWLFWAGRKIEATSIGLINHGKPTARTTPWPATRDWGWDLPRASTGRGRTVRKGRIHNWHKKENNTVKLVFGQQLSYLLLTCGPPHFMSCGQTSPTKRGTSYFPFPAWSAHFPSHLNASLPSQ